MWLHGNYLTPPRFRFLFSKSKIEIGITLLFRVVRGFPGGSVVKNLPSMQHTQVRSLGLEDCLEKGMTILSSILVWRIPWAEEPGMLPYMGLWWTQRVAHKWATNTFLRVLKFNLLRIKQSSVLWNGRVLENTDSGVRLWVEILCPPLVSCVILDKGHALSVGDGCLTAFSSLSLCM